jgi:hypothetical protein
MIALFTKCGRGNRTGLHLRGPGCEGPARLRYLVDRVARLVRDKRQPRRHHDDRTEYRMIGRGKIPEPISTGIILNVTSQTDQGFGTPVKHHRRVWGALSNEREVIVRFSEDNKYSEATFIGSYRPLDRHS